MVQVNFQCAPLIFTQFVPRGLTCSELCCSHINCSHINRPIFSKLPGLGISNMSFQMADVIELVSGTMISFSKGVQQNSNQSIFQS